MSQHHRPENRLLAILPPEDFAVVVRDLEPISLAIGTRLAAEGQTIEHVYFLSTGIASVIGRTPEGHCAEAGIFGADGYVPTAAIAGVEISAFDVIVQSQSTGDRMRYDHFRTHMETNKSFAKVMIRSIEAFAVQVSYTAISNAIHDVTERLARWLLMCHDRVPGDEIELTHEFLSTMLAVRRPSVTTCLHILEGNGFIRSERGLITIRNRAALEQFAADAYGRPEREYLRLMTGLFKKEA